MYELLSCRLSYPLWLASVRCCCAFPTTLHQMGVTLHRDRTRLWWHCYWRSLLLQMCLRRALFANKTPNQCPCLVVWMSCSRHVVPVQTLCRLSTNNLIFSNGKNFTEILCGISAWECVQRPYQTKLPGLGLYSVCMWNCVMHIEWHFRYS